MTNHVHLLLTGDWFNKRLSDPITTGVNYRVRVDFGNKIRINAGGENYKENLEFRLVFMGWKKGSRHLKKNLMQFFRNSRFTTRAPAATRHHEYMPVRYSPKHADLSFYAYFRPKSNPGPGLPTRLMRFDCGIYASVRQNKWQKVTVS